MCRVSGCCCCFGLSTGSKILAVLGLLGNLLGLANSIVLVVNLANTNNVVVLVSQAVGVVVYLMLLMGAVKRNENLLLFFLILDMLAIILYCVYLILVVVAIVGLASMSDVEFYSPLIGAAVAMGVAISLSIYFWIVVYSLFREVKEEKAAVTRVTPAELDVY